MIILLTRIINYIYYFFRKIIILFSVITLCVSVFGEGLLLESIGMDSDVVNFVKIIIPNFRTRN